MGKGIAVIFKKKFGQVDELKKQCAGLFTFNVLAVDA